jgi:shikimate dehydrogenase
MKTINGETLVTGIVGYPVRYSLSPIFQNYLFQKYKLNYVYVPFPVKKDVEKTVKALFNAGVVGLNITIPHKEKVINLATKKDKLTQVIGAANTLHLSSRKIYAYNTDGPGFWDGIEIENKPVYTNLNLYVIGYGGAAKGIIGEGIIRGTKNITVFGRNPQKLNNLKGKIKKFFDLTIEVYTLEKLKEFIFIPPAIIVNATPLGMNGEQIELNWNDLPGEDILIADIVYKPLKTPLIIKAEGKNLKTYPGYLMLAGQGIRSFEIWTGIRPELHEVAEYIRSLLNENSSSS